MVLLLSCFTFMGRLLAETLVKLPEHRVENNLIRAFAAEAWDLCQFKLL